MPKVSFDMSVSKEMMSKWCALKGYGMTPQIPTNPNQDTPEDIETELDFFQRTVKKELMNICITPMETAIYKQANDFAHQSAQKNIEELKMAAETAMILTVEDEKAP